jgi:hypothetical protein
MQLGGVLIMMGRRWQPEQGSFALPKKLPGAALGQFCVTLRVVMHGELNIFLA